MRRTYELYFRKEQDVTFCALTAPADEVADRALGMLGEQGAEEVEVREAGRVLFTLSQG
jgi:hypothetical protein